MNGQPSSRRRRTPCKVLVIDDDDLSRQMITDVLTREGHEVTSLPSPIGASRALMNLEAHVVIVDVMMPSLRGDKLAALLRKNPRFDKLGIVLVSGATSEELLDLARDAHAAAVVEKSKLEACLPDAIVEACRSGCRSR